MIAKRLSHVKASLTLAITAKSSALKAQGVDVVSFGAGEPDFDTPKSVVDAAKAALDAGQTKYTPVAGTKELRDGIAAAYKAEFGVDCSGDEVIAGVGGKQILYNACMALLDLGDKVLLPAPYWLSYPAQIYLAGATPVFIETKQENDFLLQADDLRAAIVEHKPKMLILNSPSNPTGAAYSREDLFALIEVLREHPELFVLWDNIYYKLTYDGFVHYELLQLAPDLRNRVIVASGFSKSYAMTGWRLGFGIAPTNIIKAMSTVQSHSTSNPTSFAQSGAVAALKLSDDFFQNMLDHFTRRRKLIIDLIEKIPHITCTKPRGSFYLLVNFNDYLQKTYEGKKINDDVDLAEFLIEHAKVATVPGSAFGAPGYLRLSFAMSEENIEKGIKRIAESLKALT
ncbi:MAG: pyridoxal phosphate-dependent aminotransferase [Bradymonadales bacterium]